MLVMQAETGAGQVLLASVCDGMGGLAKGEVASATMVHALQKWFTERLPQLLYGGFDTEKLWQEWIAQIAGAALPNRFYKHTLFLRLELSLIDIDYTRNIPLHRDLYYNDGNLDYIDGRQNVGYKHRNEALPYPFPVYNNQNIVHQWRVHSDLISPVGLHRKTICFG